MKFSEGTQIIFLGDWYTLTRETDSSCILVKWGRHLLTQSFDHRCLWRNVEVGLYGESLWVQVDNPVAVLSKEESRSVGQSNRLKSSMCIQFNTWIKLVSYSKVLLG